MIELVAEKLQICFDLLDKVKNRGILDFFSEEAEDLVCQSSLDSWSRLAS